MEEELITVETVEEYDIEIEEGVGWIGGDSARHYSLTDRDEADSHPITAITNLREELDEIKSLQSVYSDKKQQADYYKWQDESVIPANPIGLFVSLYTYEETGVRNGTSNIQICDGTTDVFGVTVDGAGFVGGQEYIELESGAKIGRDDKYGLVAYSGIVAVQRYESVAVGDYVVPDAFGKAKKADGKYGYLVVALSEPHGVPCAVISLSTPSTFAKEVSDVLYDESNGLVGRMGRTESDVASLTNSIQNVYDDLNKQNTNTNSSNDQKFEDINTELDNINNSIKDYDDAINNAIQQASEAQAVALSLRTEAVENANDAIARVDEIQRDIQALDYQVAPYSIGKYSQAYGLTYEQAKAAIPVGSVHIPMREASDDPYETSYKESYAGYEGDKQEFFYGYYYTWNGEKWIPSDTEGVKFITVYQSTNQTVPYLIAMEDIILDDGSVYLNKGDVLFWNNNEPKVVASAEQNGFRRAINYLRKTATETAMEITNARGDCVSLSQKLDVDEARMSMVTSKIANLESIKPAATEDTLEVLGEKVTSPDIDAYYCVGKHAPYDVYKWDGEFIKQTTMYHDGMNFCKVNTASIITAVNEDESSISLNADKINFDAGEYEIKANKINFEGYSEFINEENGTITSIDGNLIKTGTIDTNRLNVADIITVGNDKITQITNDTINTTNVIAKNLQVNGANITGKLNADVVKAIEIDASQITSGEIIANKVEVDELSSLSSKLGTVTAGSIQSSNYSNGIMCSSEGLSYELNESGDGYIVTGIGSCEDVDIIIPSAYNGLPIVEIASGNWNSIKSLIIPDSVTSIRERAFYECVLLTNVIIGNGVTSIRDYTFHNCKSLINVTIGNNVVNIGDYAFEDCNSLRSIKIPDSVQSIGKYAFYNCTSLINITIPNNITNISDYAFDGCVKLVEVCNKSNLKIIAGNEDNGHVGYNAKHIYYEENQEDNDDDFIIYITTTGKTLVSYIGIEERVEIPADITQINSYAFYNCKDIKSISIPQSVTSIGDYAFYGCTSLVEINYNATECEDLHNDNCAFSYAGQDGNGIEVIIGASVKKIPERLFYPNYYTTHIPNITSLKFEDDSICESIGCDAFYGTHLTSITIPDSVTSIGNSAFYDCCGLVEVYNKSNLTITAGSTDNGEVGYYALNVYTPTSGASKLSTDSDGFIIYAEGEEKILVGYIGEKNQIALPNAISKINERAFYNNNKIVSVVIPDSVINIGNDAFYNCKSLTNVTIGENITSIGDDAFNSCYKLVEVYNKSKTLNVTANTTDNGHVGFYALNIYTPTSGASKLSTDDNNFIIYTDGEEKILVGYIDTFAELVLPNNITQIHKYAFYNNNKITSITIPSSATMIGDNAFYNCSSLINVIIGDSVTSIGSRAFVGCNNLINIEIPDSVTSIQSYTFSGCSSLTIVTIGNGVTSIGISAFYGCSSLTSVTIGENVKNIGTDAFNGCSKLIEVYNKSSLDIIVGSYSYGYIGKYALNVYTPKQGETILSINDDGYIISENEKDVILIGRNKYDNKIIIPTNVTKIYKNAFCDNINITSLTISRSVNSIEDGAFLGCYRLREIHNNSNLMIRIGSQDNGYAGYYALKMYDQSKLFNDTKGFTIYSDDNEEILVGYNGENTDIFIPNTITKIYKYAFNNCVSIKNIIIPKSVVEIGNYAFNGCEKFKAIYYEGTQIEWNDIIIRNDDISSILLYCYGIDWTYKNNEGLCISSISDKIIDTKYFKVFSDGTIQSQAGKIGNLNIFYDDKMNDEYIIGGLSSSDFSLITQISKKSNARGSELTFYNEDGSSIAYIGTEGIGVSKISADKVIAQDINSTNLNVVKEITISDTIKLTPNNDAIRENKVIITKSGKTATLSFDKPLIEPRTFIISLLRVGGFSDYFDYTITVPADTKSFKYTVDWNLQIYKARIKNTDGERVKSYNFKESVGKLGLNINTSFYPDQSMTYSLGSENYAWKDIWAEDVNSKNTAINISDINKKKDIVDLPEEYSQLFDKLRPVTYRFKNNTSNRIHTGLIAQELKQSLDELAIPASDFAAYCEWQTNSGETTCGIRYGELISLNISETQKLKKRVAELENIIKTLQNDLKGEENGTKTTSNNT